MIFNVEMKRDAYNDIVRLIAAFCVIGVHWVGSLSFSCPDIGWYRFIISLLGKINSYGVPLYWVLSGYYILGKKYDNPYEFCHKRIVRIVIPYLIYACVYVVYFRGIEQHSPISIIPGYFFDVVTANVHPTHWFVYTIIGIYAGVPFLSKMFFSLSDKEVAALFYIGVLITLCKNVFNIFSLSFGINGYPFMDTLLSFISAYCIRRLSGKDGLIDFVMKNWIFVATLLFAIDYFLDFSFARLIVPAMIVSNADSCKIEIEGIAKECLSLISAHSFSIYLIHAAVVSALLKIYEKMGVPYLTAVFSGYFAVFLVSFVFVLIVDKLVTNRISRALT